MFISCKDRNGSAYYEFQYCKKDMILKKLLDKGYGFWAEDSLLVHTDDDEEFFKNYLKYLCFTNAPDGTNEFCEYGVNYYTREQTRAISEKIKEDRPKDFEILADWLYKAVTDYNGFFFLGI